MADRLDGARESFSRQAWGDAYAALADADRDRPLEPQDLERQATAAYLTGRDAECAELWARAHHENLGRGDVERAVRCAFWLALGLMLKGDMAPAGGWLARAQRLLDDARADCVEQGYLLVPVAVRTLFGGDPAAAQPIFVQAALIGHRFNDQNLTSLARHGEGQSLVRMGRIAEGMHLLDEVMVAVTAGEASPTVAGLVYCAVIETCHDVMDIRRAQEWTEALSRWCAAQPDLVPYRGQCLVHRSQIMQLRGAWPDAMDEAQRACGWLAEPVHPALGNAYYQLAELRRLRGEFEAAEEAYRQASQFGRTQHPGLAQLRLAQGRVDPAVAAIRRVLDESPDPVERAKMLPAYVDIMLASGDVQAARAAADELAGIAAALDVPLLHAAAAHADGAVLLAEGDARAALGRLRAAWSAWCEIDAPYEAARVRTLMGLACRSLGDEDTAGMELDAAQEAFRRLGAEPDVIWVARLIGSAVPRDAGGLTARELEVLALVATGRTNRAIANQLVISEKTVARHMSNIFTKLGVSSRSALTAYAYEHGLV